MKQVIVIGAGASGLMAAYAAARNGHRVTVLEKNEKSGKKIYITGKGRCNLTNDVPVDEFLENVVHNSKFLTGCLHTLSPQKLMQFLEEGGLRLKKERGNRVFPLSDKASDVTKCLENYCRSAGVQFIFSENVRKIERIDSTLFRVITQNSCYEANAVMVCTGGASYSATGSTGDGYRFAREFGLSVEKLRPALCGINCESVSQLQGVSLKNVCLIGKLDGRKIFALFGEMLFTHFGVSGPIVLSASSFLNEEDLSKVCLEIDFKPALEESVLDKRILRDFEKYSNRQIAHALVDLLPKRLIIPVLNQSGIKENIPVHSITKSQRLCLVWSVKHFRLPGISLRPIEEGIVTAGGVDVREMNAKTMECKKVPGLFFCGEVLNVDALTGGFNLQIAFSTGFIAGDSV